MASLKTPLPQRVNLSEIVIVADATYWGKNFGVLVFLEAKTHKILWWKFIYGREKIADYLEGISRKHRQAERSTCFLGAKGLVTT